MHHIVIWVLFIAFSSSCVSEGDHPSPSDEITFEFDKDFSGSLPHSLWSPARRRVNAGYYFLVGEYEMMASRIDRARELYTAAYNLDPSSFLGQKMIASMAINGQVNDAIVNAEKLSLLHPKNPKIRTLFGRVLLEKGAVERAEEQFLIAKKLDPNLVDSYLGLITVNRSRKTIKKAISVARELVTRKPGYADGWSHLAKLYLSSKNKKKAFGPAKRAYELRSHDPEKILVYALTLELIGKSKKAVFLYEQLFRLNPSNEELIQKMVKLYRQVGNLDEALALLKEAAGRQPTDGILLQQAFIYWEMKRYDKAQSILASLAQSQPHSDRLQYLAGLSFEKTNRWEEAIQSYTNIDADSEFYVHSRYRSIRILRREKLHERALALAVKVVDHKIPRADEFYPIGAYIYGDLKREKDAVGFLKRGVGAYPQNWQIRFLLGVFYEKLGERESCINVMRQVIEGDPKHHGALNFLGYLYAESGENLDEAKELIERALEIKPNDGFYLDSLGWVYFQNEDYDKAEELLTRAHKLIPDEGVILEHLGDVALARGQETTALDFYERALKSRLEPRDRPRVEKKIVELKGVDT